MLNVDKLFIAALNQSNDVTDMVSDRIFDPARPEKDDLEDKIPYIIVTYDGGSSDGGYKDTTLAPLNQATVSVLCVAATRAALATLTESAYAAIEDALYDDSIYSDKDWRFYIEDCTPSASAVQMDELKPCYFQTLTYQCSTTNREYEQTSD